MGWGTPHFCAQSIVISRVGREREELCQKKTKEREREREKRHVFFKTLNVPCVYKGFECLWFFLLFFFLLFLCFLSEKNSFILKVEKKKKKKKTLL